MPTAQVALSAGRDTGSDPLPGAEILLGVLLGTSILMLAAASLPRGWIAHGPGVAWQVARLRGLFAVVGVAIPLGIGIGYLVVLLNLE
jgi:hypothetical protein